MAVGAAVASAAAVNCVNALPTVRGRFLRFFFSPLSLCASFMPGLSRCKHLGLRSFILDLPGPDESVLRVYVACVFVGGNVEFEAKYRDTYTRTTRERSALCGLRPPLAMNQ